MRRMDRITGRSDDMLIIRGVNVFPSQIEEQILKVRPLAPHYHIAVSRPERMDMVTIRVETREVTPSDGHAPLVKELAHHIKTMIGISTQIELCEPGSLERFIGKAQRVTDNRPR